MTKTIEEELEENIARLDPAQKQALFHVIKSFLPQDKGDGQFTEEEIAKFYELREGYLRGESKTYSPREVFEAIRKKSKIS